MKIGWRALASDDPANMVMSQLLLDIDFFVHNGSEEDAQELSLILGREVLAWCRENFGPVDLDRLNELCVWALDQKTAAAKGGGSCS